MNQIKDDTKDDTRLSESQIERLTLLQNFFDIKYIKLEAMGSDPSPHSKPAQVPKRMYNLEHITNKI